MNPGKKRLLATLLAAGCGIAHADGVFIDAGNRTDMVYDEKRGLIYIANGDQVLRYDTSCGCQRSPIALGGVLKGIDISPDDQTLAVADATPGAGNVGVYMVNLDTLATTTTRTIAQGVAPTAVHDVLYAHDGTLVVTTDGDGLGTLYGLDPRTTYPVWHVVVSPTGHNATLASTADRGTFAFSSSDVTQGLDWAILNAAAGLVNSGGASSVPTFEIGANPDGTQFALPTGAAVRVYDGKFNLVKTIDDWSANQSPMASAYHPVEPRMYVPVGGTSDVRVYDTNTFQPVGSYVFPTTFGIFDEGFKDGRVRLSGDGSLLMVSVTGGVQYVQLYAPLAAAPVSASSAGVRTQITLKGSVGDGGKLGYATDTAPAHGQAFVDGDTLTYVPAPGFTGTDTFNYAVYYGRGKAVATVSVNVTADTTAYAPVVSFGTLPVLRSATPAPGRPDVPGDIDGDGTSDLLWFNPTTSQLGYWAIKDQPVKGQSLPSVTRTVAATYNITPGYFVGATGDFNGDGYTDLVFTSAHRDLWLWTNDQHGHWSSTQIGSYPDNWQLVGAVDIDGDGIDDLLWLDPSGCQFAYWLMNGNVRKGYRIMPVTCGYYPVGVGYYSPSGGAATILWSSAAHDLYAWDSQSGAFTSYDLSNTLTQLGSVQLDARYIWAFGGGGWGGGDIGIEWSNSSTGTGYSGTVNRYTRYAGPPFYQATQSWVGGNWIDHPEAAGYLMQRNINASSLFILDKVHGRIGTAGSLTGYSLDTAPIPTGLQWTYPAGWYVLGAPANGAIPPPWR